MWESVPEGGLAEGWVELDENGWGALIGWAAGPENLRRGPVEDSSRTVTVTSMVITNWPSQSVHWTPR